MRLVHGSDAVPPDAKGAVLALGNFDGVHRGHQALIGRAIADAKRSGRPSGVALSDAPTARCGPPAHHPSRRARVLPGPDGGAAEP